MMMMTLWPNKRQHNKDERHSLLEKYTSYFIWKSCVCERELETKQNCNVGAQPLWVLVFSTASYLQLVWSPNSWIGGLKAPSTGCCFLYSIISPTLRSPNSLNFLCTELSHSISSHNWPTEYALPPSLEWHVWSLSSRNNCHAVHRSFSPGASVCDCTVGFYPCPILSAMLANEICICRLWNGMFDRVLQFIGNHSIQHNSFIYTQLNGL